MSCVWTDWCAKKASFCILAFYDVYFDFWLEMMWTCDDGFIVLYHGRGQSSIIWKGQNFLLPKFDPSVPLIPDIIKTSPATGALIPYLSSIWNICQQPKRIIKENNVPLIAAEESFVQNHLLFCITCTYINFYNTISIIFTSPNKLFKCSEHQKTQCRPYHLVL